VYMNHPDGLVWRGVIYNFSSGLISIKWDHFPYISKYGVGMLAHLVIQCN
jgi:hypothetical protein